ncbi:SMP-30/gluconolactonase/LRE family protein [Mesorhizobium captivum]|uniref:SMP-30/gluconolactonase/LRE family protein n=1 Tax=Mesorhizobium captivum TaxID=3072319 RepID=UPI002A23FE5E|nr:SMP-30/gluconolactonase/LRE family protein [Mesorhizobium sp. VK23E]MDX8515222.1 SMP-30/gluconolactonase/LRE family protein [Mesorhizobium sp. VK23E]
MALVREVYASKDKLGEVPVWDVAEQALYWVDIEGCLLRRLDHASGRVDEWTLPERICSFALREQGGLICALASGLVFFDPATGRIGWIARPEAHIARNRFNEGKCDRQGRFWVGSMDDRLSEHTGALYRVDADLTITQVETGIGISNSLVWSPDEKTFYFADTMDRAICAYDFDRETGGVSRKRLFASTKAPGSPDGSTIDAEGYLWNAEWDGWRLVRYAPDGLVDRVVELPVQKPTSCMFGGPDLKTLFVTSAIWDLTGEALAAQPMAGSLLAVELDVPGLPEPRFKG